MRWGVDVIITDTTLVWLDLRRALQGKLSDRLHLDVNDELMSVFVAADYDKIISKHSRVFLWTTISYYSPILFAYSVLAKKYLEKYAGPFDDYTTLPLAPTTIATTA